MPREHFSNILVEHRVHYDCIMTVLQNVFLYLLIFLWFFCDAYKFIDTCLLMFCNLPGNKYTNENTNTYLLTYVALRMYRHQWRVWWAARFVESRITCLPGNHWPWSVPQDQCLSSRQLSTSSASTQLPLCSTWSWCHTPSKRQRNKQIYKVTRPFFCPSCLSRASILWVDEARCFTEISGGLQITNWGSTNKYAKFGQLIIRKIIKILQPDFTF